MGVRPIRKPETRRSSAQRQRAAADPVLARLRGRLNQNRFGPQMLARLEPYLRDFRDGGGFKELLRQTRLLLLEARTKRRSRKLTPEARRLSKDAWLSTPELERVRVLNREIGRYAENFGALPPDASGFQPLPKVQAFRRDILGGRILDASEAQAFLQSEALAYLEPGWFKRKGFPMVGHSSRVLRRARGQDKDWGIPVETVELELAAGERVDTTTLRWSLPAREVRFPSLSAIGLGQDQRVRERSVLAKLQGLGSELAQTFLWDEFESCWFVLTKELPSPPFFYADLKRSGGVAVRQYRVSISLPLWASPKTAARMLSGVQAQYLARRNRTLSARRLRLVDFVAPLWHEGVPWLKILSRWRRARRRPRYPATDARNLERHFFETWELLMRTSLKSTQDAEAGSVPHEPGFSEALPPKVKKLAERRRTPKA